MSGGSYGLRAWLEQRLRDAEPGSRLPTDRQLAVEFAITERTVRSVLRAFRDRGELVRLPGRGTFAPGQSSSQREIAAGRKSAERLADALFHSIFQGDIQRGQPLPQVKYICRQFRVSPATAIGAYRRLQSMGRVTRIGKAYWVGNAGEILQQKQTRNVYLFNYQSDDFSVVFRDNYFASAYSKLERELAVNGYRIIFESTANLRRLLNSWRRDSDAPWGLIFCNIDAPRFLSIQALCADVTRFASAALQRPMPLLIDWSDNIETRKPRGTHIMRREHVATATALELVKYFRDTRCLSARLFLTLSAPVLVYEPEDCIMFYFKLLKEARLYNPSFRLGCSLLVDGNRRIAKRIADRLPERLSKAEVYTGVPAAEMRSDIVIHDGIQGGLAAACDSDETWIFSRDAHAVAALQRARHGGAGIPAYRSLISLQNDPAYLHAGISYCGPEWERIGYAMAHTILGDIPLDKSTQGYLRTWASMLHRLTTR